MTEQQIADLVQMIERVDQNILISREPDKTLYVHFFFYSYELFDFLSALAYQIETTHGHDLTMSEVLDSAELKYNRDTGEPDTITWLIGD